MRQTKSKSKLKYHKLLRAAERKKWDLEKQARDSGDYVEIPKTLVGYKVRLRLIDSVKNKDAGLSEAVEAATSFFEFCEKPFKLCNLKNYKCEYRGSRWWAKWDFKEKEKIAEKYFQNKMYKKGMLELIAISEERYKKLSPEAKKYFVQRLDDFDRHRQPIFKYEPVIPKTYVREAEEKLYWNYLFVPDGKAQSEAKRIENWLDYKKECELWHYEGYRTSRYEKYEKRSMNKKRRQEASIELRDFKLQLY